MDFAAWLDEGSPVPCCVGGNEQNLDLAGGFLLASAGGTPCVETGGDDPAVVQDEQIAGIEQRWQVSKLAVFQLSGSAAEEEHTAGATMFWRLLRNELFRQFEIEVRDSKRGREYWCRS